MYQFNVLKVFTCVLWSHKVIPFQCSKTVFATLPINELAVITKRRNLERNEEFFDDNDERLFPHDHQ